MHIEMNCIIKRPIELTNRIKHRKLGKIAWIKPLLNVMFASSLDVVNYQLSNVMDDRYVRIQSQLTIASAEMDNTTPQNIKCLQQEANEMIEENWEVINKFCDFKNAKQSKEVIQKS